MLGFVQESITIPQKPSLSVLFFLLLFFLVISLSYVKMLIKKGKKKKNDGVCVGSKSRM